MTFSVIGLGKLGCSMVAAIASRGHRVIGYDVASDVVDHVNAARAPVDEAGLAELLVQHRPRIRATTRLDSAIAPSEVTFVVVPTPSGPDGAFLLDHATAAFREIGRSLRTKRGPHTVVLTSTVLPGATRGTLIPVLMREAGRQVDVCYSPAFVALGSVIRDFLQPDLLLIGESSVEAGDALESAYRAILPGSPPVRRMSLENAELAKIAVNTYVTTKISFANMLAELCERLPGGDVDVVSDALGLDARIGRRYLTGALGYGGPCFPRDNRALLAFAQSVGAAAPLAAATDAYNRSLPHRLATRIAARVPPGGTVAVLGLSYKPGTPVIDDSQSIQIGRALAAAGVRVIGHDPLAAAPTRAAHADAIDVFDDLQACIDAADVVLVTAPDPMYRALTPQHCARGGRRRVVIDFWRMLGPAFDETSAVEYAAVGLGGAGEPSDDVLAQEMPALTAAAPLSQAS